MRPDPKQPLSPPVESFTYLHTFDLRDISLSVAFSPVGIAPRDLTLPLVIRVSLRVCEGWRGGGAVRDRNKAKQSKVNFVWQLFASLPFVVGRADLAKTQGNINQVQIGLGYRQLGEIGACSRQAQTGGNGVFRD